MSKAYMFYHVSRKRTLYNRGAGSLFGRREYSHCLKNEVDVRKLQVSRAGKDRRRPNKTQEQHVYSLLTRAFGSNRITV